MKLLAHKKIVFSTGWDFCVYLNFYHKLQIVGNVYVKVHNYLYLFQNALWILGGLLTYYLLEQQPSYVEPLNLTAMACPAFPLCPLAITEAERGIPDILKRVRALFEKVWFFSYFFLSFFFSFFLPSGMHGKMILPSAQIKE